LNAAKALSAETTRSLPVRPTFYTSLNSLLGQESHPKSGKWCCAAAMAMVTTAAVDMPAAAAVAIAAFSALVIASAILAAGFGPAQAEKDRGSVYDSLTAREGLVFEVLNAVHAKNASLVCRVSHTRLRNIARLLAKAEQRFCAPWTTDRFALS
jgi:hypothetical protein